MKQGAGGIPLLVGSFCNLYPRSSGVKATCKRLRILESYKRREVRAYEDKEPPVIEPDSG